MAGEKQTVWRNLLDAQRELERAAPEEVSGFINNFGALHRPAFETAFGNRSLLVHSIGAYILSHDNETLSREPDERHFIGDSALISVYAPDDPEVQRMILLWIEAEAIATPPASKEDFEPLFRKVSIPLPLIKNIYELEAA